MIESLQLLFAALTTPCHSPVYPPDTFSCDIPYQPKSDLEMSPESMIAIDAASRVSYELEIRYDHNFYLLACEMVLGMLQKNLHP